MRDINIRTALCSSAIALVLSACGGGDSAPPNQIVPNNESSVLSGTAAAGAPLIGQVTVKGALGNTKSALIEADGTYEVDVSGLTAPYRLRAEGTVGGRTYKLHSYAESADLNGAVNITPFTDLIIANAAQQLAAEFFDSSTNTELDSADVEAQEAALQAKLQNVFNALGLGTAINLLNDAFSADHSGLDAALDIINVSVDEETHVATITNLVEKSIITDSVLDKEDNSEILDVTNTGALTTAVSDNQAIANIFVNLTAAYTNGLPSADAIKNYFSDDFYEEDMNKGLFLTDITTDPNLVGLTFGNVVIADLDSVLGAATITFHAGANSVMDPEPIIWQARKDATLGWQLAGDQRIVETQFSFHCNDYDGDGGWAGSCGVNTRFWDKDFANNGTAGNAPIASGTVRILAADGFTEKAVIYLGTPGNAAPGDVQVYNEADGLYYNDWKGFGNNTGEIDPALFAAGDIVEFAAYTEALDASVQATPAIAGGAVPVATYTNTVLFTPATTGKYPTATAATQNAISTFTPGDNLTVAWTLANGARSDEVLVEISDNSGNRLEAWIETSGDADNSVTFASNALDAAAASAAGLDPDATSYNLLVRVYAQDEITGQEHSRDYRANIPGPAAESTSPADSSPATSLTCNHESGWDDNADQPASFNSYDDFQTVVADCGNALTISAADIEGTWSESWTEGGGAVSETYVFNNDGSGAFIKTLNGAEQENIAFNWSVSDNRVTLTVSGMFLEILAILPGNQQKVYSEAADWSPASDLSANSNADGEIWNGNFVKQ
jgi:hypothetical protein